MTAPTSEHILIVAPRGRDGELTQLLLERNGLSAEVVAGIEWIAPEVETACCAVITQEALTSEAAAVLTAALAKQPPWCDFPIIVLSNPGRRLASELGNVTVLERPIGPETLLAAVRAALRARRRQYEARAAIQQRDQFLAMLGHELRNPLAAIVLASELVHMDPREQLIERLELIKRQGKHLARLVDDLLDVARVTSGKVQLHREAVDIDDVIRTCITTLAEKAHDRDITVSFPQASGLVIAGDTVRLEQVVSNLLANAIKYSPPSRAVTVSTAAVDGGCEIRVRDDGIGIEPEMLPRVFELFAQADGSLHRAEGGMGIGLTLVDRLVRLHGGNVRVTSEGLGQGSEFIVNLPIGEAPAAAPRKQVTPDLEVRIRVVLVEDNTDIREMTAALLSEIGCDVDVASDGLEGVDHIVRGHPDLALVDIGLPGIDGFEVARRVRAAVAAPIMLVAVTGYGGDKDRAEASEAGFDDHVAKPLHVEALVELVERSRAAVQR